MARTAGLALACLLLAGCGSSAAGDAQAGPTLPSTTEATGSTTAALPPTTTAAPPPATTPAGPSTNAHGLVEKAIGQQAGLLNLDTNESWLTFSIDAITPNFKCTSDYVKPPENGTFVALQLRVSTGTMPSDIGSFSFNPTDFDFIGPDNITVTNVDTFPAFTCLDDGQKFTQDSLGSGQQYVGQIVLDVPASSGVIVYKPYVLSDNGGWEWKF
jgi:hypothetical protein